ncbi:Pentatricopeptide repeat (PPR) superfamily protein [Euphorbia peplus]|nr:Pentatricopeptide repeat (PPR) superfamily protein [Euphorbia peplus]
MSNQTKLFTQILDHYHQSKNLVAIKTLHAHLITNNLLSSYLNIHTNIILTYTTTASLNNNFNNHKTLINCCKTLNPNDPIPFNLLLSHFSRNGFSFSALKTSSFMHSNSVPLDSYAYSGCLVASSKVKDLKFGKQIHTHLIKSGWVASVFVGSALIDFYSKLSLVGDASNVFDEIPLKNTVCANALLCGYVEAKMWDHGVRLIRKMPLLDLDYDHGTVLAMLRISTGLSVVEFGEQVHAYLMRKIPQNDVFMRSALIEMYGKCGFIGKALHVFNLGGNGNRDIVLWTSMLGICGRSGHFNQVVELFNEMLEQGVKPDGVAYITVLSACSRSGEVQLGIDYFKSMSCNFGIEPGPEHYSCVVDLLCKAGELDKAWKLAIEMANPSISMWGTLLGACEEYGNVELGKLAAQEALKLEPQNMGIYVLLSNLYAKFGMWDEIGHLRETIKVRGLKKDVGCSRIQLTASYGTSI